MNKLLIIMSLIVSVLLFPLVAVANLQGTPFQPVKPAKPVTTVETSTETVALPKPITIATYRNNSWQTSTVNPQILSGYTLVPLRVITNQSDAEVHWNGAARQVTIKYGKKERIDLVVGQSSALSNQKPEVLPIAPVFVDGSTFVPFRYVAEKLDFHVTWDSDARTIFLLGKNSADMAVTQTKYQSLLKQNGVLQSIVSTADSLVVTTSKDAAPFVFALDKPDRIVIDLAKTMMHPSDKLTFTNQHPYIAKIRFAQNTTTPAVVRIVVELKKSLSFSLIEDEKSSAFLVRIGERVAPPPPEPVKPSEPVKPPVPVKQPEPVNASAANLVVEPRVTNVTFADEKLIVQLNAPVKWTSYLLDKPDRLVIDLPGMILDEKVRKSQSSKLKAIAQVRSAQNSVSPALVKVVVDFNTKVPYKITEQLALKQIVIDFTTATIPVVNPELPIVPIDTGVTQQLLKSKKIVVIDAGHGGLDSGAVSMYRQNANEKDFNLNVALRVQRLLSTDTKLQVVMTRTNDTFLTLNDRVVVANNLKADAFVSIHANAFKNLTTIRGTETFYSRPDSIGLAQIMHKHLLETTGFPDRRVKQADYRVIMSTTMPAVLLEAGFISNPIEEKFIFDSDFQNRVAEAIVKALREYFAEKV